MINLTGCSTSETGTYDLSGIDPDSAQDEFLANLVRFRHVMYDWGHGNVFACRVPFTPLRERKLIVVTGTDTPVAEEQWIGRDFSEFHDSASALFSGDRGMSSVDDITMLERSGVRVDLCNTDRFGPDDPDAFMERLRNSLTGDAR